MTEKAMAPDEARAVFDAALAGETDPERIARVELAREFFCNPDFRAFARDHVAELNGVGEE